MEGFDTRKYVIQGLLIASMLLFAGRLFMLQVVDTSLKAEASDVGRKVIFPARGLIYDRTGKLIVGNKPIYDILVVQRQVRDMDTARFCRLLGITDSFFNARMETLQTQPWRFSKMKPELFVSQISQETFSVFQEHLFEFPGFQPRVRMVRTYPYRSAAHVVGDIGEISPQEIEKAQGYYRMGEYIGKDGIEKYYEPEMRGRKGVEYYYKDNIGRDLGPYRGGSFDTAAIAGLDVTTTLDIELQQYGEKLMHNKRGSIVAIEPGTGEVLAFISSPAYDPNLLVGRQRGKNYRKLQLDTLHKPLINRPLTALYPPGSTFKPLMGLLALQEGAIGMNTGYRCRGSYYLSGISVGCHQHPSVGNLNEAIQYSCNAYFCNSLRQFLELEKFEDESGAINRWAEYLHQFNLGKQTGIDLYGERAGNVPDAGYFDKLYEGWRWKSATVISLGIGQGEITTTPLQLANMFAILANKGTYRLPHLVKDIDGDSTLPEKFIEMHQVAIPGEKFGSIFQGLEDVVEDGTAGLARTPDIAICGKTGTAENPHGDDHSLFTAFAPREDPQIAIVAVVENSGFGGTWAAPISSLMIEYYLKREISTQRKWVENYILEADFMHDAPEATDLEPVNEASTP